MDLWARKIQMPTKGHQRDAEKSNHCYHIVVLWIKLAQKALLDRLNDDTHNSVGTSIASQ